jgi:hypothetical protein
METISQTPKHWTIENDEELVDMLKDQVNTDLPGSIQNLIRSISVTTELTSEDTKHLISLDNKTYWESDSYASNNIGFNAIRLFMKPFKKIKQLYIVHRGWDKRKMPKEVAVFGGSSSDNIKELNKVTIKP